MWAEIVQAAGATLAGFALGWLVRGLVDELDKVTHGRPRNPG